MEQVSFPKKSYIGKKFTMSIAEMKESGVFEQGYGMAMGYVQQHGLEIAGPPVALYLSWDDESGMTTFLPAFPIVGEHQIQGDTELEIVTIPEGKALNHTHMGSYDGLKDTYEKMMAHMEENGLEGGDYSVEEYVTDPEQEKDQSKWMTNIYLMLK